MFKHRLLILILLLFFLGAGLRIIGMTWGLPYQLHPDEPVLFINAWERWDTGAARMQQEYPELYLYVLVIQREVIFRLFGADTPQVIYFFFGRWNSILISLLILAATYRLGHKLADWGGGLFLMAFFAVEPISVLDQGWIIKGDNLAWLLMLSTLLVTITAHQRRSWRWLAGAFLLGLLATYAKYNMAFVFFAPVFVGLNFWIKRSWWTLGIILLVLVGGLWIGRVIVRHYWVGTIAPAFNHCSNVPYEQRPADAKGIDWLPCAPFVNFQKHIYPIYTREAFWDRSTTRILRYEISLIQREFRLWRLGIGAILLGAMVIASKRQRELVVVLLAVLLPSLFLFAMFGAVYPNRQYYVLFAILASLLAMGVAHWKLPAYGLVTILLIAPYIVNGINGRGELLKPDTRVVTAEYFLDHARRGEAILVEYDQVEFTSQYGGFPAGEGYFNAILAPRGIFALNPEAFFAEGIYYVVIDERAGVKPDGGINHLDRLPADFELLLSLGGDDYHGPARRIYRTFRPEYPIGATFGQVAELIGYDFRVDGNTGQLKLYWHSLAAALPDYTVFVHVIDTATGEALVMHDHPPDRQTSQWDQYEWVFDERSIPLDVPPGTYAIQLGLYDASGNRLPVNGDPLGILELAPFEMP
jgi:hypothetical protein